MNKVMRWGSVMLMATAALYATGGVLSAVIPGGGLASPVAPLLFYLGTVAAVPAVAALYAVQSGESGRTGFVGFFLSMIGATLYSGPQLALVAGTSGAAGWHDVWGFAMGNVLLVGPAAFFIGLILLGRSAQRSDFLPRRAGQLLVAGAAIWLVAYFLSVIPGALTVSSLLTGAALAWHGWAIWSLQQSTAGQVQPAQPML